MESLEQHLAATYTMPPRTLRTYEGRFVAPDDANQAEVRFMTPAGAAVAVGSVSFAATAEALVNSDLRVLQSGVPNGWTVTSQSPVTFTVIPVAGGAELRNSGSTEVNVAQVVSVKGGQIFSVEFQGRCLLPSLNQQNPRIELSWFKVDGTSTGTNAFLEFKTNDFDVLIYTGTSPAEAVQSQVRLVMPAGTTLLMRRLSLQFPQMHSIPLIFIGQSPGQLTITDLRVAYEKQVAAVPKIPSGGLCSPTTPGQSAGSPGTCYCQSCRRQQSMIRTQARQTQAGRPAVIGQCVQCGSTVIRLGGSVVEDAPPLSFPTLHAHSKSDRMRTATGQGRQRASPESEPLPLTTLAGIGPAREKQLREAGIDSVHKLAMADPAAVANALTGVSAENAPHFIDEAKKLLSERPEVPKR
jgi:hypothetical protein